MHSSVEPHEENVIFQLVGIDSRKGEHTEKVLGSYAIPYDGVNGIISVLMKVDGHSFR